MNIAVIFAGGAGKRMNTRAKTQAVFEKCMVSQYLYIPCNIFKNIRT